VKFFAIAVQIHEIDPLLPHSKTYALSPEPPANTGDAYLKARVGHLLVYHLNRDNPKMGVVGSNAGGGGKDHLHS